MATGSPGSLGIGDLRVALGGGVGAARDDGSGGVILGGEQGIVRGGEELAREREKERRLECDL